MSNDTYTVLSIDAWREPDLGWSWNAWYKVGEITLNVGRNDRYIIKKMRENGYLSETSKGRVAVDDDQYNLVIIDRKTREPIFAIEKGSRVYG